MRGSAETFMPTDLEYILHLGGRELLLKADGAELLVFVANHTSSNPEGLCKPITSNRGCLPRISLRSHTCNGDDNENANAKQKSNTRDVRTRYSSRFDPDIENEFESKADITRTTNQLVLALRCDLLRNSILAGNHGFSISFDLDSLGIHGVTVAFDVNSYSDQ